MTINGKMSISLPEAFLPMDQSSRDNLHFYGSEPDLCLHDKDRHMIVIVNHQKLPLISRIMLKDKEMIGSLEKTCAQTMVDFDYRLQEFLSRQIGGKTAHGFRYTYTADGIPMEGESCFIRDGKLMYNLYVYYRKQLREESSATWKTILESVKWVNV